ncbi:MAG TPA: hypothetical protein VFY40_12070 [Blastocatellia bacterium]|nr:hypothetical protein [Blastocatellia bacterium]
MTWGTVAVTATAPGAESVQILGRPEGVEDDYLELRTLTTPVDRAMGKFVTRLNLTPDFAGHVWAKAIYNGAAKKRTETILLSYGQRAGLPTDALAERKRGKRLNVADIKRGRPGRGRKLPLINKPL